MVGLPLNLSFGSGFLGRSRSIFADKRFRPYFLLRKNWSSLIALTIIGQYTDHMQAFSSRKLYSVRMSTECDNGARLTRYRKAAGLSVRELARQINVQHTAILYWESTDTPPRSNVLVPLSKALGVTVEELLGEAKPRRIVTPAGRLGRVFESVSSLPRRQQQKIIDVVEAYVEKQVATH